MHLLTLPATRRIALPAINLLASLIVLGLGGCQDSIPSAPATSETSATLTYVEEWKAPDSGTWHSETTSERGVKRLETSKGKAIFFIDLPSSGTESVTLSTWTMGVRTAVLRLRQDGASLELVRVTTTPDPVALALLGELDKAGVRSHDSLLGRYALHLLAADSAFLGFPGNCPVGIDTAVVIRMALGLAVAKHEPLSLQSATWGLNLDTTTLRVRVRVLVAKGVIPATDTLSAFPRYPVRIVRALGVSDLEVGRSVAVDGLFEGDSGLSFYDAKILRGNQDATWAFKLASSIKRMGPTQTNWDLRSDAALTISDSIAPVGTYTLVVWVGDSKGRTDTARVDFKVLARSVKPDEPRIVLLSPAQDAVFPYGTASVETRWSVSYAGVVDSVRIDGTKAEPKQDSLFARTIEMKPDGNPHAIVIQVFTGNTIHSDSLSVRRQIPVPTDSTIAVSFVGPSKDTTVANSSTTLAVALKTNSVVRVDSVVVSGVRLSRSSDSTMWTGTVDNLAVGANLLSGIAYAGVRKRGDATRTVTRGTAIAVDSTIAVSFVGPSKDTTVANSSTTLPVAVKTISVLHVDSVVVAGVRLSRTSDSTIWTGTVTSLAVGGNPLSAMAYATSGKRGTGLRTVDRSAPVAIDSTVALAFLSPGKDTAVSNSATTLPIALKTVSVLRVDSVVVAGVRLSRTSDSTVWTGTVQNVAVGGNFLVAKAYASGKLGMASIGVLRRDIVGAPQFSPAGGELANATWVKLSDTTAGAELSCSVDGKNWQTCKDSVFVQVPETLQVRAVLAGRDTSKSSAAFVVRNVSPVSFSPSAGRFSSTRTVTLSTTTPDATFEYSWDALTWQSCAGSVEVASSGILYARANHAGMISSLGGAKYQITRHVAIPVIGLPSGTYPSGQSVSVTDSTSTAIVQWSYDSASWSTYAGPIPVTVSRKLFVRATGTDLDTSYAFASYVISAPAPRFGASPGTYAGSQELALIPGAASAAIRYSLDRKNWYEYTGPFLINANSTVYASETVDGMGPSDTIVGKFDIQTIAPSISPDGGTFSAPPTAILTDVNTAAPLYYSFDGSTWTHFANFTLIDVKESGTLYAKAEVPGQVPSVVVSAKFVVHDYPKIANTPALQIAPINQILSLPLGLQAGKFSPLAVREYRTRKSSWIPFSGDNLEMKVPWNADGTDTVVVRVFNANGDGDSIRFPIRSWFLDTRDSTYYNRVLIGGKVWMGKDLSYNSGSQNLCASNDTSLCKTLGRVYGGNPSALAICPTGWILPASADWRALVSEVSGGSSTTSLSTAQLKTLQDPDVGGTNNFGFSIVQMFGFSGTSTGTSWASGSGTYLSTTTSKSTCSGHTTCTNSQFEGLFVSATSASISTATWEFTYSDYMSGGGGNNFNKARCIESP